MRRFRLSGLPGYVFAMAAFAAAPTVCAGNASASTYQLLHSFCQGGSCQDAGSPQDGLLRDSDGNLFGAANGGGANGHGAVFELKFNSSTQQYHYLILHNFCAQANCADGAFPDSPLIMDIDGNLYGTTTQGGAANLGIIFKLFHHSNYYTLHVLHDFCTAPACEDGSIPVSGLTYRGQQTGAPYDGVSPLYGATERTDSAGDGTGVVYQLRGGLHHYKVLHTFCLTDCADGEFPSALALDRHGHLFGVTEIGGVNSHGVIFELHPNTLEFDVLYNFCSRTNCADGDEPDLRQMPVQDSTGALYGTTFAGGRHDMGTVWKFKPLTHKLAVLYNFCSQANCADGAFPRAGVTLGPAGEIYGETPQGGRCDVSGGCGVVFALQGGTYSLLHSFCADGDPCPTDGAEPFGGLLRDPSGTLFGVTAFGGTNLVRGGTAFRVTP